jgi:hypothetical protein
MTKQQIQNQKNIHKNAMDAIQAAVNKTDIESHKNDLLKPVHHHLNEIAKLDTIVPDGNSNMTILVIGLIFGVLYLYSKDSICLIIAVGSIGYLLYSAVQKNDSEIN